MKRVAVDSMFLNWKIVNREVERLTLAALALPVLIGLAVVLGWHLHVARLIQIRPGYIGMVYNSGWAFAIAGLGIWAALKCHRAVAIGCAVFLSVLGSLSGLEHVFGEDLGIDQLVIKSYINVGTSTPGRMAPNTALALILVGAAIALVLSGKNGRWHLLGLGLVGALAGSIGMIPFIGYLLGISSAYTWSPTVNQMAVHTAVALISLGLAISAIAWSRSQEIETGPPEWFPWVAGLGGLAMTLLLWQALLAHNRQEMTISVAEAEQSAEARLEGTLRAYISPLERMGPLWEQRTKALREWQPEVVPWLDSPASGGYAAILSVNPNRRAWVASNENWGYEALLARAAAISWDSPPDKIDWGNHVRLICAGPVVGIVIRSQSTRGAFLLGVLRFGRTLKIQMDRAFPQGYNVVLAGGNDVLYERNGRDKENQKGGLQKSIRYLGANLMLSVWQSRDRNESQYSVLSGISLGVGLLVSVLLTSAMRLVRTSALRALQLEAAQHDLRVAHEGLELKILERTEELAGANLELNKTAQQYRFLSDAMPQIVWTSTPDGNLDYYNQRWYEYTGLSVEQSRGWGWKAVLHPDDLQNCIECWTRSFSTGKPYQVEYRFRRALDGVYRWHLGRGMPMHNEAGEVIKWFGTCTDIDDYKRGETELREARGGLELRVQERTAALTIANTSLQSQIAERQLAELQLREQKEQFRLTLETANDAFVCIDATGSVIEWNRQAEVTFGWSKQEAIGRKLDALIMPQEYREAHHGGVVRDLCSGQGSMVNQLNTLHRSGLVIPVDLTIWLVRDGDQVRFNAFLRDVTGRMQMEEDVRQNNLKLQAKNRQVEEASRMKTAFLANMSHELRTPLNGIIGFTELMADGLIGQVSNDQKQCLDEVLSSSRHLLGLINNVLDVAKVESGTLVFKPERIVVSDLVNQAVSGLRPLALQKDIHLEASVDPLTSHVYLDPQKFTQVLLNYLSNALKFTPAKGTIRVAVRPDEGQFFRLEVEDSGIGIAEEDIGRLFQEFQQLDGGTSKQFQGTGLGLALTRRLVEAQGGKVGVRSTLGQGSIFFAILPVGHASVCPLNEQGVLHGQ